MLPCQKQFGQWTNPKLKAIDPRTIYPLKMKSLLQMATKLSSYGDFYSTASQTLVSSNTPAAMTYTNSSVSVGMSFSGSQITVARSGYYWIASQIQINRVTGNTATPIAVWLRVNGVDVPQSGTSVNLTTQIGIVTITFVSILQLISGQYFEVYWCHSDTASHIDLLPTASQVTPFPAPGVPSVSTEVFQIA